MFQQTLGKGNIAALVSLDRQPSGRYDTNIKGIAQSGSARIFPNESWRSSLGRVAVSACYTDRYGISEDMERQLLFWDKASPSAVGAAISRPLNEVPLPYNLTSYGNIVNQAVVNIQEHYSCVCVDKYVIMPDHVHILLRIDNGGRLIAAPTLRTIVGQMKRWVSKQAGWPL